MTMQLPLNNMTIAEKLNVMEMIWDDLCHQNPPIESPAWHFELLQQREQNVANGTAKIMSWEDAKQKLRRELL